MPHAVLTFHGTVTVLSKLLVCRNCCEHCCVWQILWSFLQVPPKVWRVLCHSCVDYMGEQKTCVAIFSVFPCDNTWTLFGIIHVINVSCGKNRIHKFPFFVAVGRAKPDPTVNVSDLQRCFEKLIHRGGTWDLSKFLLVWHASLPGWKNSPDATYLSSCIVPLFPRPVQDLPHWCFQFEEAEDLLGEAEPGQTEGD